MPSGHSSSSHSSSSSGSSSGGSHSGSSGGFSSGGGGGHSHHNDSHSIFPSHIQGLFWFIGVAVVFGIILFKVDINEELNRHSNSNPVIYETVSSTGTSGVANTSSNTAATTAETSHRSTQSFKKYSPGYGIIHERIYSLRSAANAYTMPVAITIMIR